MEWQLADAKNRFSELVTKALQEGPQRVTRRKQAVVVVSAEEYDRLTGRKLPLNEFLLRSPSLKGVDLSRDKSPMRDATL